MVGGTGYQGKDSKGGKYLQSPSRGGISTQVTERMGQQMGNHREENDWRPDR